MVNLCRECEVKKSVCFFCHRACGVLVHLKDRDIMRVSPDPAFPGQAFCGKPKLAKEFHHHSDRLNYPLKRSAARGEGRWKRISWEQALDEIAERLAEIRERYGAEAVSTAEGDTRTNHWAGMRFLNLFGSPNHFGAGAINYFNALTAHYATYGCPTHADIVPGVTKCIVDCSLANSTKNQDH